MKAGYPVNQSLGTVKSALVWAVAELQRASVEFPRRTAEILLEKVLGWDPVRLLSNIEARLAPVDAERFAALVCRRAEGEPLQYITGEQDFYGLPFHVSPAVLIPRPETEILVEKVLKLAEKLELVQEMRFADIGTGSGCVAIAITSQRPQWRGWAVDISPDALGVARLNAVRHNVAARIEFIRGNFLNCFAPRPCFDFILSNPPYVARAEESSLDRVVRDHEPHVALFGGESGLESYRRLIPQAGQRLFGSGHLLLEVGQGQATAVVRMLERGGFLVEDVVEDLQGIPRCIVAQKN